MEFESKEAPDQNIWPGAKPLCSTDLQAKVTGALSVDSEIPLENAEARVGIVRCGYFYLGGAAPTPAGILVAGAKADVFFIFVPDSVGALRLASIRATTVSRNYDSIKSALVKKYGQPQFVLRNYVQDAAGTNLVDETARWSNGVSEIRMDQRGRNIELMSIEYLHEELWSAGMKRLKAVLGDSVDTL